MSHPEGSSFWLTRSYSWLFELPSFTNLCGVQEPLQSSTCIHRPGYPCDKRILSRSPIRYPGKYGLPVDDIGQGWINEPRTRFGVYIIILLGKEVGNLEA